MKMRMMLMIKLIMRIMVLVWKKMMTQVKRTKTLKIRK